MTIKKLSSYLLSVFVALCLLVNMTNFVHAAGDVTPLKSGQINVAVNEGDAETSIEGNKYIIVAKDLQEVTGTDCDGNANAWKYTAQTSKLTFSNVYGEAVKIEGFSLTSGYTIQNASGCNNDNGNLIMNADASFQIVVTSPGGNNTTTVELSFTRIGPADAKPRTVSFVKPEYATLKVIDDENTETVFDGVSDPASLSSTSFTVTATPANGYEVFQWIFTKASDKTVTIIDGKNVEIEFYPDFDGQVSCVLIPTDGAPTDAAEYQLEGDTSVTYKYLDLAINAANAGTNKRIVLTKSGTVYASTGLGDITIPSDASMVLPYTGGNNADYTGHKGPSLSSTSYFPYGNYTQQTFNAGQSYYTPCTPSASKYLRIPAGTTVTNNGIIMVGGTLAGNAATYGSNHQNLVVDGELKLPASSSILSVCGYVTGGGIVEATGDGAKVFQPMVLLRPDNWGWSLGAAGKNTIIGNYGMETYATDATRTSNPAPLYTTQNIQCDVKIAYGATMYGYLSQYCDSNYHEITTALVGKSAGLIGLKSGAVLKAEYDADRTSSKFSEIGKLSLTIEGGATMGTASAIISGYEIELDQWPFPVPYNYDIVLKRGTYDVGKDLTLLPGAGLKVESGATLNVTSSMAVFTGAYDHSIQPSKAASKNNRSSVTVSYGGGVTQTGTQAGANKYRYPTNDTLAEVSTLNQVSGGSLIANFIVNGTLNISGSFGGIVQTTEPSNAVINMNADAVEIKRQLGMAGQSADLSDAFAHAGQTIYKFKPQFFGVDGELYELEKNKTYRGANTSPTTIETFSFDLYTKSGTATRGSTEVDAGKDPRTAEAGKAEPLNGTAVGQWYDITITYDANGGEGTMDAQLANSGVATTLPENGFTAPAGYHFAGWNTAADGSGETTYAAGDEFTATGNTTLYAQWKQVYKLTLDPNGGEVDPTEATITVGATYGDAFDDGDENTENALPTPTYDGYTFKGWFTEKEGGTEIKATDTVAVTGDTTLYAQWEAEVEIYTLTLDPNGGEVEPTTATITVGATYGDAFKAEGAETGVLPTPTRTEEGKTYRFNGWYTAADDSGVKIEDTTPVEDTTVTTLYAHWVEQFTVTWNDYNSTELKSETLDSGSAIVALEAPTRAKDGCTVYTFAGWDKKIPETITENLVFTATYSETKEHTNVVTDAAVAETCTTAGKTEGSHCGACHTVIVEQTTISATGHENTTTTTVDATCTTAGSKTVTCDDCGETVSTEAIPAKNHDYGEASYTWSDNGKSCTATRVCERDASHKETTTATVKGIITTPATCTEIGTTTYTATFGVEWATEQTTTRQDVAVIAHTYNQQNTAETYKKSKATCEAAAVYYYSCSCGAKGTETFTCGEALGHTEQTTYNRVDGTTTHTATVSCTECLNEISTATENCVDTDNDFKCDACGGLLVNAYTDAVIIAEECTGTKSVDGTTVTLKYTGDIRFAQGTGTNLWSNWVGFKITAPVDISKVTILRPDGATRVMANIKDGTDYAYLYWGMTDDADQRAEYKIDWNGDGTYDLTVILDATAANLLECEHVWDDGVETTPPTCTAAGEKTFTCANCDGTKIEEVAATGHVNTTTVYTAIDGVKRHTVKTTCSCDEVTVDTTADCVDSNSDNKCDNCERALYVVTIDDRTIEGDNKATTSLIPGGKYVPGETFTVKCAMACVVAISYDNGETFAELSCTAVPGEGNENTYQFTIPADANSDFKIGIVLRGDARGDGEVKANDGTTVRRYALGGFTTNCELDSLTYWAADARGDGEVKANDGTTIRRYALGGFTTNCTIDWNILEE